jgi:hypothetical protein
MHCSIMGSREGPTMTAHPFSTFPVRGKKDAIRARHRARQIASLLRFSPQEQACIAAGTFAVVCQALDVLGKALLCFQIEANQLQVFIRVGGQAERRARGRRSGSADGDARPLLRLVKPLPEEQPMSEADLAWLIDNAEESPIELFEEVVKQNQEVLGLLHELAASQRPGKEDQPARPSAA